MSTIVVSTTSYLQHWEEEPLNLLKSQVDLSQKEDLGKCLINVYLYTRDSNRGIAKILLKNLVNCHSKSFYFIYLFYCLKCHFMLNLSHHNIYFLGGIDTYFLLNM